ncbi:312_t:CDS:2 [Dentiscutata erythropus]|uniref:312_t:CDS:1 n=1 Tax=Dentiscutata erythropus TaxID=1348616 RepID=A0A9N9A5S7_9GLOM|nr:312_t:CDS:2 [Dentiscutata erythropus]
MNFDDDIDTRNDDNSLDLLDNNFIYNDNEALDEDLSDNNIILPATPINNNSTTIFVGQTFDDWQKVEKYINAYAISKGFATRLQRTNKIIDFTTRAKIICRRANAPVRWAKTKYYVRSVNLEHNHLLDTAAVMFDPRHRKLSNSEKSHIQMLYNGGMPVPTIVNMLTEQYNRYIHNKDVYNILNNRSRDYVNGLSETANLLNSLSNNDKYEITYSVNNSKLHCLFFTTNSALAMFKCYPEILLIDSMYKTNRFEMPLLLIYGVDTMGITFLIASRLLANETTSSFCWILQQLKQLIGDILVYNIRMLLTN